MADEELLRDLDDTTEGDEPEPPVLTCAGALWILLELGYAALLIYALVTSAHAQCAARLWGLLLAHLFVYAGLALALGLSVAAANALCGLTASAGVAGVLTFGTFVALVTLDAVYTAQVDEPCRTGPLSTDNFTKGPLLLVFGYITLAGDALMLTFLLCGTLAAVAVWASGREDA